MSELRKLSQVYRFGGAESAKCERNVESYVGQVSFAREFGALAEASQAGEERSFDVFAQNVEGIL